MEEEESGESVNRSGEVPFSLCLLFFPRGGGGGVVSGAEGGRGIVKVLFLPSPGKNGEGGSSEEKVELLFRSPKGGGGEGCVGSSPNGPRRRRKQALPRSASSLLLLSFLFSFPPPTRACERTNRRRNFGVSGKMGWVCLRPKE